MESGLGRRILAMWFSVRRCCRRLPRRCRRACHRVQGGCCSADVANNPLLLIIIISGGAYGKAHDESLREVAVKVEMRWT